jgi:hypothetical protein
VKTRTFHTTIVVRGSFDAAEEHTVTSMGGRTFTTDEFEFHFQSDGQGWKARWAEVSGQVIKKNGEPGLTRSTVRYWLHDESTPQWVHAIVEGNRPDTPAPRPRHTAKEQ